MPQNLVQAPRYTNDDLDSLISKARVHSEHGYRFNGMTDYEVLQYIKRKFPKYNDIPSESLQNYWDDHFKHYDPRTYEAIAANQDDTPPDNAGEVAEQLGMDNFKADNKFYNTMDSMFETLPAWLSNSLRAGYNESLTGMASNVTFGSEAFQLPEDYDPNLLEMGLSFGASMLYDSWFFALTDGIGLLPRLAGKKAMEKTSIEISKYLWKDTLMANAGILGLKNAAGKKLTQKEAKRKITRLAKGEIDDGAESLIKAGADENVIKALVSDAKSSGADHVSALISNPLKNDFWKKGYKKFGERKLKNPLNGPGLTKVIRDGAIRSGTALGLYDAARDVTGQAVQQIAGTINPETGEPYGNDAPNVLERWKHGETFDFDWDVSQTLWSGLGGVLGGMFAGGLNSVLAAGRAGAWASKSNYMKYIEGEHPKVMERMYSQLVGLNVEAAGFTGIHEIMNKVSGHEELDEEGNPVPFREKFLHNLVNIGLLKGFHKYKDQWKLHREKSKARMKRDRTEVHLLEMEANQKILDALDPESNPSEKAIYKDTLERMAKGEEKYKDDLARIEENFSLVTSLLEKTGLTDASGKYKKGFKKIKIGNEEIRVPRLTMKELDKLEGLVTDIVKVSTKNLKDKEVGLEPELISKLRLEDPLFDALYESIGDKNGLFAKLRKDVEIAEKFSQTPDSQEKTNAMAKRNAADDHRDGVNEAQIIKNLRKENKEAAEVYKAERERLKQKDIATEQKAKTKLMQSLDTKGIDKILAPENPKADKDGYVKLKDATLPELESMRDVTREQYQEQLKLKRAGTPYDTGAKGTIEERIDTIKGESAKPLGTTHKKLIEKSTGTGEKEVEAENSKVLELIARSKSQQAKGKSGADIKQAASFGKWLYAEHGLSIKEANQSHLEQYLSEGNAGKPFGWKSTSTEGRRRANDLKKGDIMRWVKELSNIEGQGLAKVKGIEGTPLVTLKMSATERLRLEEEGKGKQKAQTPKEHIDNVKKSNKSLEKGDIQLPRGKKVKAAVGHFINFVRNIIGKRSKLLRTGVDVQDINILKDGMIITIAGEKGESFDIRVPNEKILGVNYYEIFKEAFVGKTGKLFVDIDGVELSAGQLKRLNKMFGGEHSKRDNIYEIAAQLDAKGIDNSLTEGTKNRPPDGWWTKFAKKSLVFHGKKKGETAEKFYEAGYSKEMEILDMARFWREASKLKGVKTKEEGGKKQKQEVIKFETIEDTIRYWENFRKNSLTGSSGYELANKKLRELESEKKGRKQLLDTIGGHLVDEGYSALGRTKIGRFVRDMVKRNPGLLVMLVSDKQWAGHFYKGLMKLDINKINETTFFHENVHRLEEVIKATGNKKLAAIWDKGESIIGNWATNHPNKAIREEWKTFKKEYEKEKDTTPEKEFLTELSARWSAQKFRTNTKMGKMGNWIKEAVSYIKTYFGFGTPIDIARKFGRKAEIGFSSEGVEFNANRYQKIMNDPDSAASKRQIKEIDQIHIDKGIDSQVLPILLYKILGFEGVKIKGSKIISIKNWQAEALIDFYERQLGVAINKGSDNKKKHSKEWLSLNTHAHALQIRMGITEKFAQQLKRSLGIKNGSLEHATRQQIKQYIETLDTHGKPIEPHENMWSESFIEEISNADTGFGKEVGGWMARRALPLSSVLRKFGGETGKKLARKIEDHYIMEGQFVGAGMAYIHEAVSEIGDRKMKYIPFILDPALMESTMHKDKEIFPKLPDGLNDFILRYNEGLADFSKGGKGNKEFRASRAVEKMLDMYWRSYEVLAKEKIKNPRLLEEYLAKTKKKYVEQYFTRVLTEEAKSYLSLGSKGYLKGVRSIMNDLVSKRGEVLTSDINSLQKDYDNVPLGNKSSRNKIMKLIKFKESQLAQLHKDSQDPNTKLYKEIENNAAEVLSGMLKRTPNNVQNKFTLDRLPRLDNVMVNEAGKKIQIWETDFDKVMGQYMRTMSNYLATVKHFNEFTDVRGHFADDSGVPMDMLRVMSQNSQLGSFIESGIKRRIGLEQRSLEGIAKTKILTQLGRYSALFGLSSPFSGLKNLAIGTNMTIGIHGFRAYLYGITKLFSAKNWRYAREQGWLEFGTKELELNRWQEKTLGYFMKSTEGVNRLVSGFAGEFNAGQLVQRMRNGGGLLGGEWSKRRARNKLKSLFNLTNAELIKLEMYGMDIEALPHTGKSYVRIAREIDAIIGKIGQYGHIRTQGASGDPFLPLWAGNKDLRAITLFYRMAYSGTANVQNHIVKPAMQGDLLPMVRYGFAADFTGGLLWSLYDKVLGQAPPKLNEDALARVGMNLAKTEALGLYSFLLSPYSTPGEWGGRLMNDSIMQPAIIRNTLVSGELILDYISGDKDFSKSLNKNLGSMIVALGHAKKFAQKQNNKYKTDYKKILSFKRAWERGTGRSKDITFTRSHPNSEYYNLIKDEFYNNNLEQSANYYLTTWYYLYDSYRVGDGRLDKTWREAQKRADNALTQVIDKMNPLDFSTPEKSGTLINDRKEFLEYLRPEEKEDALKIEKQYHYRRRQLMKEIHKKWKHHGGIYNRGKVIDPFQGITRFPATGDVFGIRFGETGKNMKYKKSQQAKLGVL